MIYLFSQDMECCIPFGDYWNIQISDDFEVEGGCEIHLVTMDQFYDDKYMILATYKTKEDCLKVMEYFKKQLDLGCRTFVFPSQMKVYSL